MLWGIAGVLFVVWLVAEVVAKGASGIIHLLAIIWVISLVAGLFTRKA